MYIDYSTINREAFNTLDLLKLPPTYSLQRDPGNGCYLNPPGHPSYFTRSVYTQHGNTPGRKGTATLVLSAFGEHRVMQRAGENWWSLGADVKREKQMADLYRPLQLGHPRTQAWIAAMRRHYANCYRCTVEGCTLPKHDQHVVLDPTGTWGTNPASLDMAHLDGGMILKSAAFIREYYPEYDPESVCTGLAGDWWERHNAPPRDDAECVAFMPSWRTNHWKDHGDSCQFCGKGRTA